ncbi:MAG: Hsp33 family molecular chaperone HslO [Syntrophomonadales bacterium]
MNSEDVMLRAMDRERMVRISVARTTALVEEARVRQDAAPTAAAALGRALTAAVMMGLDLKDEESITLRINGGGPLGTILAVAESDGTVRGYVSNPEVNLPEKYRGKLDVGGAVGTDGFLEVVRDMRLRSPFTGRVPLQSGEIAEDMAYYFTLSEQIPSLVSLGVLIEPGGKVSGAGGLFVQAMPGASDELLKYLEERVLEIGPISNLVQGDLVNLVERIMGDIPFDLLDKREVAFRCQCNMDKVVSIVAALEEEDIQKALESQGCLEICCNFCGEVYTFSEKETRLMRGRVSDS